MKNRISTLIALVLMIAAVACAITQTAGPPTTDNSDATSGEGIQLRYWILDAPPKIESMAEALDFERIGFVRPTLYCKWNPRRFDPQKALRNFDAISEALDGMDWMITDLEGEPRRRVRYPHEFGDESDEVRLAVGQYMTMWAWFRNHFPDLKLSEWNLSPGKDGDHFPMAEKLVISQLDAIDISMYWQDTGGWLNYHRKMLEHAVELGREHDKPVIVWIWDRYKVWNEDHSVAVYTPLTRDAIDQVIKFAVSEGVDIVVLWSNTYAVLDAKNPERVIAETVSRHANYDPRPAINARMVSLMTEMRRKAEALRQTGKGLRD